MKQATREEYERAKRLALATIKARSERDKLHEPPTAEALLQAMQEKAENGEPPTEKELAALAAAMAAANPPKRGRGRPKGSRDFAAKAAFFSACVATKDCGLTTYRNSATGRKLTLCDALAEAMNEAGYTSFATYDAAAAEMKATRRQLKQAIEPIRAAMQRIKCQMNVLSQNLAPLTDRIRAAIELSPQAKEALKRIMKTDN